MAIDKIMKSPTPTELVKKVNDVVDVVNNTDIGGGLPLGTRIESISKIAPVGTIKADDGAEWTEAVFPDFFNWLLTDGQALTCTYAEWQAKYTMQNGNVAEIAVDTVSRKFKMPSIKSGTFVANKGDTTITYEEASLPRLKGSTGSPRWDALGEPNGAFYQSTYLANIPALGASTPATTVLFDAQRSSSTYKDGNNTWPTHIRYYYYMVVANVVVTASDAQMSEVMGAMAGKANKDFSNTAFGEVANIQAGLYSKLTLGHQKWAIEYFTDKEKTNRVWVRQGGFNRSTSTGVASINVSFLVPFTDLDSIIANRTNISSYNGAVSNQTAWHGFIGVTTSGLSFSSDLTNQPKVFWQVEGV